jgi:hypothetical protein
VEGPLRIPRAEWLRLCALGLCLAGSLAAYVALALLLGSVPEGWVGTTGYSVPSGPLYRAFTGLPAKAVSPEGFGRAFAALIVGLWGLWAGACGALHAIESPGARRRAWVLVTVGAVALLAVVVWVVPPVLSADLYRQAIYGRMVLRGLNPYAQPAAALAGDPLLPLASFPQVTTTYGPAYTWLSAIASAAAPSTPLGAAIAWKMTAALAALGCAALAGPVARAIARDGSGGRTALGPGGVPTDDGLGAALWLGWNPLVVLESAGSGHLESIMMLPALAGLLFLARGRRGPGVLALVASTLTKWVTGVLLFLAAVYDVRQQPPGRRLGATLRLGGVAALATAVLYAPFARGLGTGGGIHDLAVRGAGALGGGGAGGGGAAAVPQWAMLAGFALLVVAVTPAATSRGWSRLVAVATALTLVFVLVVVPWLFPWYLVAPVALAAVLPDRTGRLLRFASVGLGAALMLYYAKLVPAR